MAKAGWFLAGVGALLGLRLLAKVRSVGRYRVKVVGLRQLSVSGSVLSIVLRIEVDNPTAESITVQGITGKFFLEGVEIGSFESSLDITIAARQVSVFPVTVTMPLTTSLLNMVGVGLIGLEGKRLYISAAVVVHGVSIPIDLTVTL
jgi:LEA14-like dessication related protein